MSEMITVRGYVATEVRLTLTPSGLPIAGFRMCSTERRFDRAAGAWTDGHTNWYSVSMFRQLATNGSVSLKKGDRIVVVGRLKVRPWSKEDGRSGTSVEIDADAVGHDLMWGTAAFRRSTADKVERAEEAGIETGSGPEAGPEAAVPEGVDPVTGQLLDEAGGTGAEESVGDGEVQEGAGADRADDDGRAAATAGAAF
ncbi:single-stranded DNA-binding protein [Arthrobacter sp. TMN-37]